MQVEEIVIAQARLCCDETFDAAPGTIGANSLGKHFDVEGVNGTLHLAGRGAGADGDGAVQRNKPSPDKGAMAALNR